MAWVEGSGFIFDHGVSWLSFDRGNSLPSNRNTWTYAGIPQCFCFGPWHFRFVEPLARGKGLACLEAAVGLQWHSWALWQLQSWAVMFLSDDVLVVVLWGYGFGLSPTLSGLSYTGVPCLSRSFGLAIRDCVVIVPEVWGFLKDTVGYTSDRELTRCQVPRWQFWDVGY